jgi:hypothetical protein
MGTTDGISLPSASAPVNKKASASVISNDYDYSRGYFNLSRVLTFNYAGFGQPSFSGQRLGFCLWGRIGLLSRRRDFFLCHL